MKGPLKPHVGVGALAGPLEVGADRAALARIVSREFRVLEPAM